MTSEFKLVTWNVLAAPWASAIWYPKQMDPSVLKRETRTSLVANALATCEADLICLQETTPLDLEHIAAALGPDYETHFASNSAELWANWGTPETPWEPNGTAVIYKSECFKELGRGEIQLGPHGNVAVFLNLVEHTSGQPLQVISAHLDSDDDDRRRSELPHLFAAIDPAIAAIIAGDYNEDTISTDFGEPFFERGFIDVFATLGSRLPTHPYSLPGDDISAMATIDHVLVVGIEPTHCSVVDAGIWEILTAEERMEELLRRTGSDHLALTASLAFK